MIAFCFLFLFAAEEPALENESLAQLAKVRRVYVDVLTGGETAATLRELLISSLQRTRLFVMTEDEQKADAILKGAGEDEVFTDFHSSSDSINAHTQLSLPSNSANSRYSDRGSSGVSVGENENHRSEERRHEAIATVRLVSPDGDVLWAATEESMGGKFLGASADVADKIAKKLTLETRRARSWSKDHPESEHEVSAKAAPAAKAPPAAADDEKEP